jgi:hypothetical protein
MLQYETHHHQTAEAAAHSSRSKKSKSKTKTSRGEEKRRERAKKGLLLTATHDGKKTTPSATTPLSLESTNQTNRANNRAELQEQNTKRMERNSFSVRANCERKTTRMRAAEETIYIDRVGKGKCKRRSCCCCCCCKSLKQTWCANQERRRMGERERRWGRTFFGGVLEL